MTPSTVSRSQPARFYPPLDFLPVGRISWAKFADNPPDFILKARTRTRGKKRAGVLYEARVHEYLAKVSEYYMPGPWIVFTEEGSQRVRWSQPDALFVDFQSGLLTIIEIKLKHTDRAWWQIRRQYEPLLRYLMPRGWTFAALEIAHWIDPHGRFPEQISWAPSPTQDLRLDCFNVHLFSGRG